MKRKRIRPSCAASRRRSRSAGHQHQQDDDVGRDVLEALGQVEAGQRLDDADDEAADDRARQAAEAADDRRRNRLQADEAHVGVDEGDRREQQPGDRGDGRGQAPDQPVQPLHRNAHVVGGELVLRRRLHRDADLAVAEHRVEHGAEHGGRGDHDHLLDVEDERRRRSRSGPCRAPAACASRCRCPGSSSPGRARRSRCRSSASRAMNAGWPRIGRMTTRSRAMPNTPIASTVGGEGEPERQAGERHQARSRRRRRASSARRGRSSPSRWSCR